RLAEPRFAARQLDRQHLDVARQQGGERMETRRTAAGMWHADQSHRRIRPMDGSHEPGWQHGIAAKIRRDHSGSAPHLHYDHHADVCQPETVLYPSRYVVAMSVRVLSAVHARIAGISRDNDHAKAFPVPKLGERPYAFRVESERL